jgi:uncharacterized protein YyaL (SSP411 family)
MATTKALHMARFTLERMVRGGINDQLAAASAATAVDDHG